MPRQRRRVLSSILALATMTGAASFALSAPAQAKPIAIFIGKSAVQQFCTSRGGTYWPGPPTYGCVYTDSDGEQHTVVCPSSGYGCEFFFTPPSRPKSGAAALAAAISANIKLEPQRERRLSNQIIAEQARSAKVGKAK